MTDDDQNRADAPDDTDPKPGEPASAGVVGEDPNRFDPRGAEPLDEAPDGQTPSDTTQSTDDSLPPG